jgi:RimJ/RimL family protein N-acetyltransferase
MGDNYYCESILSGRIPVQVVAETDSVPASGVTYSRRRSRRRLLPMSVILETERLILRPSALDDLEGFAAMFGNAEVMQFLATDGKAMPRFGAWQSLCSTIGHWALRGYGMFAVVERASGQFVGRVGPWFPEEWPGLEIGWTLRREAWGKGFATEAAERCLAFAFLELGQSHVISLILPENVRSIHVAERLGERLERQVTLPHLPDDRHVLHTACRGRNGCSAALDERFPGGAVGQRCITRRLVSQLANTGDLGMRPPVYSFSVQVDGGVQGIAGGERCSPAALGTMNAGRHCYLAA